MINVIHEIIKPIIICICIYFLIFEICLFFILKKEDMKSFFAFIPILNIFYYYKICKLPFWTFFVPVVNVITFICSSYRILCEYEYNRVCCILAIFFPYIFLPHLAFSRAKNKRFRSNADNLKTVYDVEQIEKKLTADTLNNFSIQDNFNNLDDTYIQNESIYDNGKIENIEDKISSSNTNFMDEFDSFTSFNTLFLNNGDNIPTRVNSQSDDIIEIMDDMNSVITTGMIDSVEDNIIENSNKKIIDNSSYYEYKTNFPSIESIAFGGENKNNNFSKAKKEELKCDRCGSNLIGANGFCPGCGKKL